MNERLEFANGNTTPGQHILPFNRTFPDLPKDYYLVAVVDSDSQVTEDNENNNKAVFAGTFITNETVSGKNILHVHATDGAEVVSILAPSGGPLKVTIRQPISAQLPEHDPYSEEEPLEPPPYVDFSGERIISQIDADAVAYTRAHTAQPATWKNPVNRKDVNNDGYVSPIDGLIVYNYVNANGPQIFTQPRQPGQYYYDVTGDHLVSHFDGDDANNSSSRSPWRKNWGNPLDINANGVVNDDDEIAILAKLDSLALGTIEYDLAVIDEVHVRAHSGADRIIARTSAATIPFWLFGGGDNDNISGSAAADILDGGAGDDRLEGREGNDLLTGGAGNDTLIGREGADTLEGGDGSDTIDYSASPAGVTLRLDQVLSSAGGHAEGDYLTDNVALGNVTIENIIGSAAADFLFGNASANSLSGGGGNDDLFGEDGNDTLTGGEGNDDIAGGDGDDTLNGDNGNDFLGAGPGTDNVSGGDGDDRLFVGPGDSSSGGSGSNTTETNENWQPAVIVFGELTTSSVEGDDVIVSASRTGQGGQHAVTVTIALESGTATLGSDFSGSTYTVTIPADGTGFSNTFTYDLLHDIEVEPDENYWLRIVSVDGGYAPNPLGQMYITDVYMEIESADVLVVNDDDDNDDQVADYLQSDVSGDDEPQRVIIKVPSLNSNMVGYKVEITTSGPINLWTSQDKLQPVPSGTQLPAASEIWLYAEGTGQGGGRITARLISQAGEPAAQIFRDLAALLVHLTRDGVPIAPFPQTVWVGEKINLEVVGALVSGVQWEGITGAIKNWGQPDGGGPSNSFAKQYDIAPADLTDNGAPFDLHYHWYVGGDQRVTATISIPGSQPTVRTARFTVRRPNANVTSVTDEVHVYATADTNPVNNQPIWQVQLGQEQDPAIQDPKPRGIIFTMQKDDNAPAGEYQWVQLINSRITLVDTNNDRWTRATVSPELGVLDTAYPFPPPEKPEELPPDSISDSPATPLVADVGTQVYIASSRQDYFSMYLMWKSNTAGSIFVPLRVTDWDWGYQAEVIDGGPGWRLLPNTSWPSKGSTPQSVDTTHYPQWDRNSLTFGYQREE